MADGSRGVEGAAAAGVADRMCEKIEGEGGEPTRTCVVTGANSGIGYAVAGVLARRRDRVVMVCRNRARGEAARSMLIREFGHAAIDLIIGDLSSMASVRVLAASLNDAHPQIDLLVNNAGALFSKRELSVDGVEMSFATNFLGPFLLTNLLLDGLKRSRAGRIVNLTSSAQAISKLRLDDINFDRRFYYIMRAYGGSKRAVRLFTAKLADELAETSVCVNSFDPGLVRTSIGTKRVVGIERFAWWAVNLFSRDAQAAADFIVHLGTSSDLCGVSGQCFTAKRSASAIRAPSEERLAQELWDISCAMSSRAAC